jgi:hypothetical protein
MRRTPEKKRKKNTLQTVRRAGRLSAAVVANEKKIAKTTGRRGVWGPPHTLYIELYSKDPEGGRQQTVGHFPHPTALHVRFQPLLESSFESMPLPNSGGFLAIGFPLKEVCAGLVA